MGKENKMTEQSIYDNERDNDNNNDQKGGQSNGKENRNEKKKINLPITKEMAHNLVAGTPALFCSVLFNQIPRQQNINLFVLRLSCGDFSMLQFKLFFHLMLVYDIIFIESYLLFCERFTNIWLKKVLV